MKREKLLPPAKVDIYQLADALGVAPKTIIGFMNGSNFQGRTLQGFVEAFPDGKAYNSYELYLWFDTKHLLDWLQEKIPELAKEWRKEGKRAERRPGGT